MTKRSSLITLTGLLTGVIAIGFSFAPPVSAQPTKSGLRAQGRQAIERGQQKQITKQEEQKWQNMTPQQRQNIQQEAMRNAKNEQQKWQSQTPQQQQQEKQNAMAGVKRLQKRWQQLPQ